MDQGSSTTSGDRSRRPTEGWFQVPSEHSERLDWPKESDGIQLQITTNNYICTLATIRFPMAHDWGGLSQGDDEGKIEPWEAAPNLLPGMAADVVARESSWTISTRRRSRAPAKPCLPQGLGEIYRARPSRSPSDALTSSDLNSKTMSSPCSLHLSLNMECCEDSPILLHVYPSRSIILVGECLGSLPFFSCHMAPANIGLYI